MNKTIVALELIATISATKAPTITIAGPVSASGWGQAAEVKIGAIDDRVVQLSAPLSRPASRPCIVKLFDRREFQGDKPLPLAYRPPADCPGPWEKIVLEGDLDVTAGTQFDRTAALTLGGATLFVGTTMEPGKGYAPHWVVERDVTDYAALLLRPADGTASLANFIDDDHDGRVSWAARLVFYPRRNKGTYPSLVVPVTQGLQRLDAATPVLSNSLTLPRNMTKVAVDIFAMGQARDEFWFDCQPQSLSDPALFWQTRCTAPYREVEVRIDGVLAGVRAVPPVIFTGGITPALWRRAPGLHATNLPSARIDLTPFAGRLNDGKSHVIALAMPLAGDHFRVGAVLLGQTDPDRAVVSGAVTANTLAPARIVNEQEPAPVGATSVRTIGTTADRAARVEGYIDTGHGRVTTRIDYALASRLVRTTTGVRKIQRLDLRQTATSTTTIASAPPSVDRLDEHDTMSVDIHVSPPRHGVKYGTEVTQTAERTAVGNGMTRQVAETLTTFAPSSSVFAQVEETPYRVTATYRRVDAEGCDVAALDVADDDVIRFERFACSQ